MSHKMSEILFPDLLGDEQCFIYHNHAVSLSEIPRRIGLRYFCITKSVTSAATRFCGDECGLRTVKHKTMKLSLIQVWVWIQSNYVAILR
jgi:hypothetical protein